MYQLREEYYGIPEYYWLKFSLTQEDYEQMSHSLRQFYYKLSPASI